MTKSYIVDPETGKLLTAQEWKERAGENVSSAKMVAIIPEDGSKAFAFPVEIFGEYPWPGAMEIAQNYKAPHPVEGSDGTFNLPTRKQAVDFRMAREAGLDQLLEMIGAKDLIAEFKDKWGWTCEKRIPAGTPEDRWSCVRLSSGLAWLYDSYGMSNYYGFTDGLTVRPVTLLNLNS